MGLMDLTEIELVQGGLSLIITIIYFIVGIKIASKYFTYKRKELITVGISFAIMSGYSIYALSFVTFILFDFTLGFLIFLIATLTIALIAVICWMYTFSLLIYPNSTKKIVLIWILICALWEVFLIYFLIVDPTIVALELGKFDIQVNLYGMSLLVFALASHMVTISIFCYKSLKSDDAEIKWRGIFILIGGISIVVGLIIEMRSVLIPIIIIARIIIISSAIEYYIGWVLPRRIANWFAKDDISVVSIEEKDEVQDFLKILSRPKKITEEEILYHKEKKICLVCKSKILRRKKYVCPKCDILYCIRCSDALINLENACWVCNEPIDESKPVRPYKDLDFETLKKTKKK